MAALAGVVLMVGAAGCGSGAPWTDPIPDGPTTDVVDGNRDGPFPSQLGKTSGEPNDAFAQAIVAVFDEDGVARLQGTVAQMGDLDVFRLGPLSPGDTVIVDASTTDSALDVSIALFDDEQRLTYNNDDREGAADRFLDSYIEWVVRHAGESYYLVVTHSAFAGSGGYTGTYAVDVGVVGGFDIPEPAGQMLLLDFEGGQLDSPLLGTFFLDPFDGASISPVYQGETQTIKDAIRTAFVQNFEQFDVTIVTTDDELPPAGTLYSTIFFGGFNADAFGIADAVDLYNVDFCDDAVIFTESFEPRLFLSTPTAEEMGIAIGNIGSHEAGHLLGLNHVDDDRALMDDESVVDAFLADQEFMEASLSSDIMPIGTQDAVLLLDEIVGPFVGNSSLSTKAAFRTYRQRSWKP